MPTEEFLGTVTVETTWTCRFCSHVNPGLSGDEERSLVCARCGNRKGEEAFDLPPDPGAAPAVRDPRLLALADAGANWRCPGCDRESRSDEAACGFCGRPRPGSEASAQPENTSAPPAGAAPEAQGGPPPPALDDPFFAQAAGAGPLFTGTAAEPPLPDRAERWGRARPMAVGAAVATCVLGLVALVIWLLLPHPVVATASEARWTRTQIVLQRTWQPGENWRGSLPSDARVHGCETRQRTTENCHPRDCNCRTEQVDCNCTGGGTREGNCRTEQRRSCTPGGKEKVNCRVETRNCKDQKNGSAKCDQVRVCDERERPEVCTSKSERVCDQVPVPRVCQKCPKQTCSTCYDQCPVMDQWCRADIPSWHESDRRTRSGSDANPLWPGLQALNDDQRVDSKETLEISFTSGRQRWTYEPRDEFEYRRIASHVGKKFHLDVNRLGGVRVNDLAP